MDTNKAREKQTKEQARNLQAFHEVIGDPQLDIEGVYWTLQCRSSITPIESKYGITAESVNPSKPSLSDFFCDVENVLKTVIEPSMMERFNLTYMAGENLLTKNERKPIEQKVGRLLRSRGISPIKRYFTVVRG